MPRDEEERELVEHVVEEHELELVELDPDDDRAPEVLHVEFHEDRAQDHPRS